MAVLASDHSSNSSSRPTAVPSTHHQSSRPTGSHLAKSSTSSSLSSSPPSPPRPFAPSPPQSLSSSSPRDRRLQSPEPTVFQPEPSNSHSHSASPKHGGHRRAASNLAGTQPRSQRSAASGILSLAAAALDRTQSAIASLSEEVIRPLQSYSTAAGLSRQSHIHSVGSFSSSSDTRALARTDSYPSSISNLSISAPTSSHVSHPSESGSIIIDGSGLPISSSPRSSSSARSSMTLTTWPEGPSKPPSSAKEMHQTSSRLLRMTDDDRPFTKDLNDLFSTLIVSLIPLSAHRVRLTKVEYTFLSEDAINNLASLKFSQSNRMPDPKDPTRIVTTTTTTTFSMAKDMARSICQRFVDARFIESADGRYQQMYTLKGSVWQLTPKGISILDRFCAKNGILQKQVTELAGSGAAQLVILERDQLTDKLMNDWATIEVIFRRFVGVDCRNLKPTVTAADSDSLHDYKDGLTGVKMAAERKVNGRAYRDTFTGKATSDWLMDCSTIIDRREADEIASRFVEFQLMEPIVHDRGYTMTFPNATSFQPTRHSVYQIAQRGKTIISGNKPRSHASESDENSVHRNGFNRDSNNQRLERILNDAALRLLFRENLRDTHCEENLSFYKDVNEFVQSCKSTVEVAEKSPSRTSTDAVKEVMAQAYGIYNAYLAPGSPCELNIDHQLRNNLATRMTKAVGQEGGMIDTLGEVISLFEDARLAVFKLMASDSVPKFLRNPKYESQLRNFDIDATNAPGSRSVERNQSKATPKTEA